MSPQPATDLLGPAPVDLYECGADRFWIRRDGSVDVVDRDDGLLLDALSGFRTVGEHVQRLQRMGFAELRAGDLAARLRELLEAGLIASAETFLESLPQGEHSAARPSWAAWITCDRPELLLRGLQSWINADRASPPSRLAVLDDSQGQQTRSALSQLNLPGLQYAGPAARKLFLARLAGRGIPEATLTFALCPDAALGTPYGAARNAALLALAGEAFLSNDDDVLFEPAVPVDAAAGIALSSRLDPGQIGYYPDEESLHEALHSGGDLRAAHAAFLGKSASECAREAAQEVVLREFGGDLARRLASRPHRILATVAGLYGDSGFPRSSPLRLLGEAWFQATASEQAYDAARGGRHVTRLVGAPTIAECGYLTGHHFGLDNRELLPPFFPVGRREDGLFALSLRMTHPEALTAHLAVAARHDPAVDRRVSPESEPVPQPLFADVLSLMIGAFSSGPAVRDPAARLRALAAHMAGMASLEAPELERWVRGQWVSQWASEMALCEQRVGEGPAGAPWVRDCAARLEQIEAHIMAGAAVWPLDLGRGDPAAAWEAARDRLRRFAELLEWWPAIVAAARDLKDAGQGLLQPLRP